MPDLAPRGKPPGARAERDFVRAPRAAAGLTGDHPMEASFIIPLFNCLPLTQACVASLRATLPRGLAHEIILVDDGSTDGTRAWLQGLAAPCRVLLNPRNLGYAGANNRAAATATGRHLFLLNNDLVFPPGWFEPMRALLDARPEAGLVGNVQLRADSRAIDHTGVYFTHQGKPAHLTTIRPLARLTGRQEVAALTAACCALRRDVWQDLGGFDEGYRNGGEDIDLCLRARAAGRRNYVCTRSRVLHHVSQSPGRKQRDEANTRRLFQRWREVIAPLAARDWSREYVARHWDRSHVFDDALGRQALAYRLGLLPRPPAAILAGVQAAMDAELARWDALLGAASPPT
ncbi:MAG: glycosyltransferase family 2 protein [Opitutaceae bacterium]|nr:glycosyltransferase family 2 protein [Opitutaceae bacterium]